MMYMLCYEAAEEDEVTMERLAAAIKSTGHWSNRMGGMWLIQPHRPLSAAQIRDHLKQFIGDRDRLFVARISQNWAGRNMGQGFTEWVGRRDFGQLTPS
jgi:hypothetical protein